MFKKKTPKPSDPAARRNDLAARLAAAEDRLTKLRNSATVAARDTPDKLGAISENAYRAEFEIAAIRAAIEQAAIEQAEVEETARREADKAQRQQTSHELRKLAADLEKAAAPLPDALEGLRVAITAAQPVIGDSGFTILLANLRDEVPAAIAIFVSEIRRRADETINGIAPPTMPAPFIPTIVEETPKMPTTTIFTLERLSWLDERGQRLSSGPFQIHALPTEAAKIALQRGLAIPPDSDRYKEMRETARKVGWPHLIDAQKTYDLDRPQGTTSVFSSGGRKLRDEPQFEVMPAKPPHQVEIDVMLPK